MNISEEKILQKDIDRVKKYIEECNKDFNRLQDKISFNKAKIKYIEDETQEFIKHQQLINSERQSWYKDLIELGYEL